MKEETEIEKIKRIMSMPEGTDEEKEAKRELKMANHLDYTPAEKFTAIRMFEQNTDASIDLSFLDSVEDFYNKRGYLSDKQTAALNKIITGYNIDVMKWIVL